MGGKKLVLLFLALLLPVVIFIFLRLFGKNEFAVPLLYEEGVSNAPATCNVRYPTPYFVPDSIVNQIKDNTAEILVLNFSDQPTTEMQVVREEFDKDAVMIKSASSLNFVDKKFLAECILLMSTPNEIVLIDSENRIRGYYRNTREEVDRLILELKIMLKKY
jgi:hypothetical protein